MWLGALCSTVQKSLLGACWEQGMRGRPSVCDLERFIPLNRQRQTDPRPQAQQVIDRGDSRGK